MAPGERVCNLLLVVVAIVVESRRQIFLSSVIITYTFYCIYYTTILTTMNLYFNLSFTIWNQAKAVKTAERPPNDPLSGTFWLFLFFSCSTSICENMLASYFLFSFFFKLMAWKHHLSFNLRLNRLFRILPLISLKTCSQSGGKKTKKNKQISKLLFRSLVPNKSNWQKAYANKERRKANGAANRRREMVK